MKILLLGDGHAYGHGLPARQLSYVGHFVRQLSRSGRSVTVEVYAHLTLAESIALLARLPLGQYDLIVLQASPDLIGRNGLRHSPARSAAGSALPLLNPPARVDGRLAPSNLRKRAGAIGRTLFNVALSLVPTVNGPGGLRQLLALLRPYRHTTLLMTPFPRRTWLGQWPRERSRSVLLSRGIDQAFSVFDTGGVVGSRDEYFLTDDDEHLNAVSHELIGRALFDFYQSAPTIVTVQTTHRN